MPPSRYKDICLDWFFWLVLVFGEKQNSQCRPLLSWDHRRTRRGRLMYFDFCHVCTSTYIFVCIFSCFWMSFWCVFVILNKFMHFDYKKTLWICSSNLRYGLSDLFGTVKMRSWWKFQRIQRWKRWQKMRTRSCSTVGTWGVAMLGDFSIGKGRKWCFRFHFHLQWCLRFVLCEMKPENVTGCFPVRKLFQARGSSVRLWRNLWKVNILPTRWARCARLLQTWIRYNQRRNQWNHSMLTPPPSFF